MELDWPTSETHPQGAVACTSDQTYQQREQQRPGPDGFIRPHHQDLPAKEDGRERRGPVSAATKPAFKPGFIDAGWLGRRQGQNRRQQVRFIIVQYTLRTGFYQM